MTNKPFATHNELTPCAFMDDGVFATKTGECGIGIHLKLQDSECMEVSEMETVVQAFDSAMKLVSPGSRVYQYLIKRKLVHVSGERGRAEFLEAKAMFAFDLYLVIMRPDMDLAALRRTATAVCVQLEGSSQAVLFGKDEMFVLLRRLLNYDPVVADNVQWRDGRYIAYYAADSRIVADRGRLKVGDYATEVLVLKDTPLNTFPDMLRKLREIQCQCVVVSEWCPVDSQAARAMIEKRTSHFHRGKYKVNFQMKAATGTPQERPEDRQKDASANAMETELGALMTDIEKNGTTLGSYALTVIVYDIDAAKVERAAVEAFKALAQNDAILLEERYNVLPAWFAALPGGHKHQRRAMYITNRNYADLSMLFAPSTGKPYVEELKSDCLAVLETRQMTPYYLNLHYGDVLHTALVGQTGAGKSYTASWLIDQAIARYNATVVIFDIGGSYKSLVARNNGAQVKLGLNNEFTMAPFSLPLNEENLLFLHSFVTLLMSVNGYKKADPTDDRIIENAIKALYELPVMDRRLRNLELPDRLSPYLDKWREFGRYAAVFDNAVDTLTTNRLQAFDFEGLDKYVEVIEPFLFYVFYRLWNSVDEDPDRVKIFLVDECWKFLANESAKGFIRGAFKTFRKKNAGIWIATQSLEDLIRSGMDETVVECCPSMIFFPNPGMQDDKYKKVFHLNDVEIRAILTMRPKNELLFVQPGGSKILKLNAGTVELPKEESDEVSSYQSV